MKLAVFLSGSGTTLENIFEHIEQKKLPVEVVAVISTRKDAFGLERAKRRGVPTFVLPRKEYGSLEAYTEAVFAPVREAGADLVVMAGCGVLIGIPKDFRWRILNIHPALLPSFGGQGMYCRSVYEEILAWGVKVTGCTVHFADEKYDHGPIVIQKTVDVRQDDTPESLASRVQVAERQAYPEAIRLFAEGRLRVEGRRVRIST